MPENDEIANLCLPNEAAVREHRHSNDSPKSRTDVLFEAGVRSRAPRLHSATDKGRVNAKLKSTRTNNVFCHESERAEDRVIGPADKTEVPVMSEIDIAVVCSRHSDRQEPPGGGLSVYPHPDKDPTSCDTFITGKKPFSCKYFTVWSPLHPLNA